MKVLIINGSPKINSSNTLKLTNAFMDGVMSKVQCDVKVFSPYECDRINPCKGCYTCWTKTPGQCVYDDDMPLNDYIDADLVIWSFPLYYHGMPSKVKCVMDRLLPLVKPNIHMNNSGGCFHPKRYDVDDKRIMLISTCGFCETKMNYEALIKQFDLVYDRGYHSILCTEGELFRVDPVKERCDEYLEYIRRAGEEYAQKFDFTDETKALIGEKLFESEAFINMANAEWDIDCDFEIKSKGYRVLSQMAAVYNSKYYTKDIVLEVYFSDCDEIYQLWITQDKCCVVNEEFKEFTTRIDTTLQVWTDISNLKYSGPQAMMDGLYSVSGRFDTMIELNKLFDTKKGATSNASQSKKTNMKVLLLPVIAFWTGVPISEHLGAIVAALIALVALLFVIKFAFTIYDYISIGIVFALSFFCAFWGMSGFILPLSYIIFGVLWGVSCFTSIPLTAYYSVNEYSEEYFNNPIFIKTNRILTLSWAVSYVVVAGVKYLINSDLKLYSIGITILVLALMCVFTRWFIKYYPAYIARKR